MGLVEGICFDISDLSHVRILDDNENPAVNEKHYHVEIVDSEFKSEYDF